MTILALKNNLLKIFCYLFIFIIFLYSNMLISINYLNYPAYLQLNLITVFKILINYFEKIESNNILNILNNTQTINRHFI